VALARTSSGPPWAQENPSEVGKNVDDQFQAVGNDCGTAILGTADLSNADTAKAFDALVTALDSGQKDHMVQSVRVLMENCAAHPNDGLKNALYHHGLNWVRHYEHEQWLQQKFADKWPDGKPGQSDKAVGKPETAGGKPDKVHGKPDKVHGNPHDLVGDTSGGQGHGNDQIEGS
jgi:hypothetical protein